MRTLITVKDSAGNVYTMPSNTSKCITEIHYSTSYYQFIVQDVITGDDGETLYPEKTIIVPIDGENWVDFISVKENELGELEIKEINQEESMRGVTREQAILISEQSDKLEDIQRQIEEWIRGGNQTTALDNIANILNIESEDK